MNLRLPEKAPRIVYKVKEIYHFFIIYQIFFCLKAVYNPIPVDPFARAVGFDSCTISRLGNGQGRRFVIFGRPR